jgi:PspA-Associated protein
VIVRIATEGQYELSEESRDELGELDNQVVAVCRAGDEEQFKATFGRLLDFVRAEGQPLGDDRLVGSDLILPPPDLSLEEARAEFTGEGLIPG